MPRNLAVPRNAIPVETFDELRSFLWAFATGHHPLLVVLGPPGVAKSKLMKLAMLKAHGNAWRLIEGKPTPLGLYELLYKHRYHDVVFDDVDGLVKKPDNVALLKALCDTRDVKRIAWASHHAAFRDGQHHLPKAFDSISHVAIVANDWAKFNRDLGALEDRAVLVEFRPSAIEVHREVAAGGWFSDAEVFDFVGRHLHLIAEPSMRRYVNLAAYKAAGQPWQELFFRSLEAEHGPRTMLVARLMNDAFASEEDRAMAFVQQSGKSRATYFRYKQRLESLQRPMKGVADSIELQPPRPDLLLLHDRERREFLQEQGQQLGDDQAAETADVITPESAATDRVERLRRALERAIQAERFERAAKLRDRLRRMEADDSTA